MTLFATKNLAAVGGIIPGCWIEFRGRHRLLWVGWGILIALLLSGCDLLPSGSDRSAIHPKEITAMPTPASNPQVSLPPIDRRISPATATATFALG